MEKTSSIKENLDFSDMLLSPDQATIERLAAEMQLLALGHVIPLNIKVDLSALTSELENFKDQWVDYLPRTDRTNNRQGLSLFSLPGDSLKEGLSLPEAGARLGRRPSELEFNAPTELYHHCKSIHPLINYFMPIGRTFFVKCNKGGWFYPHRDHPHLFRESMRIVVFCKNSKPSEYDWFLDDRKIQIEEGRAYYVNTRLVHRTVSYVDDSVHLIMNIPATFQNSQRIVRALQYSH
jgi:hypothetical protein